MIFYSFNELTIILPHLLEWGSNTECYKQLIINFGSIFFYVFHDVFQFTVQCFANFDENLVVMSLK